MEEARRSRQRVAEIAGLLVFFAVLIFGDWLGYAASLGLFRVDPGWVPDGFHVVLPAPQSALTGARYFPAGWSELADTKAERSVHTYRLPEVAGSIPGKTSFAFAVLEDDGARQLVEVTSTGVHRSRSRYEAYADRILPVGYQSYAWQYQQRGSTTVIVLVGAAALFAGFAAGFGANRLLLRLQKT